MRRSGGGVFEAPVLRWWGGAAHDSKCSDGQGKVGIVMVCNSQVTCSRVDYVVETAYTAMGRLRSYTRRDDAHRNLVDLPELA